MKRRLAVILGLASVLLPAKAFGGPIGYTAGFSISAVAGAPRQSFTSNLLTPVSSYEDSRTIFDTGTDNSGDAAWSGSATTTVEISASGGSIGEMARTETNVASTHPDRAGFEGVGRTIERRKAETAG